MPEETEECEMNEETSSRGSKSAAEEPEIGFPLRGPHENDQDYEERLVQYRDLIALKERRR